MICRCGREFCYGCGKSGYHGISCNEIFYEKREEIKNKNQEKKRNQLKEKIRYWKKIGKKIPDHLKDLV